MVLDYLCGPSLVTIGYKLWPVLRKLWQFHLNMNIEGQMSRCDVTSDVINIKNTFSGIIGRHLRSMRLYEPEVVPEVECSALSIYRSYWCAILIAHQLLWQNMEVPVSIYQESPLAGEPHEGLFHIHSVHRYQVCAKYLYPSTLLWLINCCNL